MRGKLSLLRLRGLRTAWGGEKTLPLGLTLRDGVFSMHTSREERERAGLFHFVLQASASHELDGLGERCAESSYSQRRRSLYARQRIEQSVCVCVFIELHITAQSGPVILVILCHSH